LNIYHKKRDEETFGGNQMKIRGGNEIPAPLGSNTWKGNLNAGESDRYQLSIHNTDAIKLILRVYNQKKAKIRIFRNEDIFGGEFNTHNPILDWPPCSRINTGTLKLNMHEKITVVTTNSSRSHTISYEITIIHRRTVISKLSSMIKHAIVSIFLQVLT
jgi:hypothetical protein